MENHPIPQDITGFQFKLIGDMTIKQFAYLAGGVISAWLFLSSPLPFFIKFPLLILCGGLGAGMAFFPIAGRPMDVMLINFLKALFVPNQYLYQKIGGEIAIFSLQPAVIPSTTTTQVTSIDDILAKAKVQKPRNKLDEKELVFFQNLASISTGGSLLQQAAAPQLPVAPTTAPMTTPEPVAPQPQEPPQTTDTQAQSEQLNHQVEEVAEELQQAQQAEHAASAEQAQVAHEKSEELERQLQEIMMQKAELEKQLIAMSQKLQTTSQPVFSPSEAPVQPKETVNARKITGDMGAKVGLPIAPEVPNLIVGIVKDPRGNIMPNVLVEVRDGDGNPVRAFKTNQLGQFAAATPLLNGTYTLAFEDPSGTHKFELIQIEAAGEIIPPLEIISTDAREELRKTLFGA